MGNAWGLLVIGAICWLALLAYLTGALLRRAERTRTFGTSLNRLAFLLYVLGAGATAVVVLSYVADSDLPMVATLYGIVTGVPLLVCAIQFHFRAPQRKRDD
jgi:hypothetical protein